MDLSAFKIENASAKFAEITHAKDLAPSATERAVQVNSVQQMDSVSLQWESSNQNALRIVTAVSENSAGKMNATKSHRFVGMCVATLALLMETALLVSSVEEKESVSSQWESSNHNALRTVTAASENSVVTMSASQNHSFVGQFVVTLALLTTTATLVNSVIEKESVSSQ